MYILLIKSLLRNINIIVGNLKLTYVLPSSAVQNRTSSSSLLSVKDNARHRPTSVGSLMSKLAALDGVEPPSSRSKRVIIAVILKSNIEIGARIWI